MKNDFIKLNRRGAAIAIALLIFLLCALAGASAYIMAVSNAGRYSHANEQEYYSVSSAALLLVDMMDDIAYTSQLVNYDYQRTWNYADGKHETSDGYTLTIPSANLGVMGGGASTLRERSGLKISNVIREQCDKLVPYLNVPEEWYASVAGNAGAPVRPSEVPSVTYEFTVTVQDGSGNADDKYGTVNCKLVMNANYDLLLTFNCGNGEYAITVYWVAEVQAVQTTSEPEYVYADSAVQDENGYYTVGTMTQKRTLQVTVTWKKENVTISRGEAITNE